MSNRIGANRELAWGPDVTWGGYAMLKRRAQGLPHDTTVPPPCDD